MSQPFVVDGLALARQRKSVSGQVAVCQLSRLHEHLERHEGKLDFVLVGRMGQEDEPLLTVRINGELLLRCQRCLDGVRHPVRVEQVFELREAAETESLTQQELEDDSRDFLPADSPLDVATLIEDELLLDLPVFPRHDICKLPDQHRDPNVASPFEVLRQLKKHGRATR